MTIAVCYVSPEGIVLGADSTSSYLVTAGGLGAGYHYFNHNQKLFEVGEKSTLGIVTWGLAGLGDLSLRTMFARLGDELATHPVSTVLEAANVWSALFFAEYRTFINGPGLGYAGLAAKSRHDPVAAPVVTMRTKAEEDLLADLSQSLVVGFCLAGRCGSDRKPTAFSVVFQPSSPAAPAPAAVAPPVMWWGVPNLISRLVKGYDSNLQQALMRSGKWSGTPAELQQVLDQQALGQYQLPLRDAVDYVHACIASTIKGMKFSQWSQFCGGPIEIAVITSDRPFRWVRHKPWDAAIDEGARA